MEPLDAYTGRARTWLEGNMPPADKRESYFFLNSLPRSEDEDRARIERCRELQRLLFDGGFAGITVPKEYGGQGLTPAHQAAFNRELKGYDYPAEIQASTFVPCMALLLEFGTEEQKRRHIPLMLKGEEIWVQFLSEPGGGSDAAGAATTAVRDGDVWLLNGSKSWTTSAWCGDWALCLARTNWDVEKHRGLTVFSLPVRGPGVEVHRIELLNGSKEFGQEFLTNVAVPDRDRIGDVDAGWTVVTRWLYHERTIAGGSQYVTGAGNRADEGPSDPRNMVRLARGLGFVDDARVRGLIGEADALSLVGRALVQSVAARMRSGALAPDAAALVRLFGGVTNARKASIAFEVARRSAVAWPGADQGSGRVSVGYLMRQAACIGGGTTEMARNIISERLLGLPREPRADAGAFREVPRGPSL